VGSENEPPKSAISQPWPERLYHYTTRETALNAILPTGQIRLGLMRHLNDPRESKMWRVSTINDTGAEDSEFDGYPKSVEDLEAFHRRFSDVAKSTTKILALAQDAPADDPHDIFAHGYAHPRMWTHYAGGHTGVCLVFDRASLERAIETTLGGKGDLFHDSVYYADEASDEINAFTIRYSRIVELGFDGAVAEHVRAHHQALFFRKNTDWASEWEYRWVLRSPEPAPEFVPIVGSLRQVIRGDAFPDGDLDAYFHQLERYPNVATGLLRWLNGGPILVAGTKPGDGQSRSVHFRGSFWTGASPYADGRPGPHPDPARRDRERVMPEDHPRSD
jgi:hypothetical protein